MHSSALWSTFAYLVVGAVAANANTPETRRALAIPRYIPEISVVEANKSYVVKLNCVGCHSAYRVADDISWQRIQDNALRLGFNVEDAENLPSVLSLNGHGIMPLGPMPLAIDTWQVASNLTTDDTDKFMLSPSSDAMPLSMAFEHTILRTEKGGQTWIQFDVTKLYLQKPQNPKTSSQIDSRPVVLEEEGQKLVQILLQQDENARKLSIADIQVVAREAKEQPYRMKCGKLAMAQTRYDPSEWDQYGKLGTWSRYFSKMGNFLDVQHNPLLLPLSLMLALGIFMARRWMLRRQQDQSFIYDDEAEVALLGVEYEDLPPAYANIPMIKIEEYD